MRIDPLSVLVSGDFSFDKKFYYISGNEITLMEKVLSVIIERFKKTKVLMFSILIQLKILLMRLNFFLQKKY